VDGFGCGYLNPDRLHLAGGLGNDSQFVKGTEGCTECATHSSNRHSPLILVSNPIAVLQHSPHGRRSASPVCSRNTEAAAFNSQSLHLRLNLSSLRIQRLNKASSYCSAQFAVLPGGFCGLSGFTTQPSVAMLCVACSTHF